MKGRHDSDNGKWGGEGKHILLCFIPLLLYQWYLACTNWHKKMYSCITRQMFFVVGAPSLYGAKNIFLNTLWKSHHESNLPKNKTPEIFPPSPSWTWPPCLGKSAAASSRDLLYFSTADNQKNASCCWFFCEKKRRERYELATTFLPPYNPQIFRHVHLCARGRREGEKRHFLGWGGGDEGRRLLDVCLGPGCEVKKLFATRKYCFYWKKYGGRPAFFWNIEQT